MTQRNPLKRKVAFQGSEKNVSVITSISLKRLIPGVEQEEAISSVDIDGRTAATVWLSEAMAIDVDGGRAAEAMFLEAMMEKNAMRVIQQKRCLNNNESGIINFYLTTYRNSTCTTGTYNRHDRLHTTMRRHEIGAITDRRVLQ